MKSPRFKNAPKKGLKYKRWELYKHCRELCKPLSDCKSQICTRDKNATQPAFFTLSTKTIRDNAGVPNHQTGKPDQNEKGVTVLLLPFLLQLFAKSVDDLRQFERVLHHRQMPGFDLDYFLGL
jgi:hypothetical protein